MSMRAAVVIMLIAGVTAAALAIGPAMSDEATTARLDRARAEAWPELRQIAVMGASVSAGWGTSVNIQNGTTVTTSRCVLADFVDAAVSGRNATVTNHSSFQFFQGAARMGPFLLDEAMATEPTMVIGVDFLFWFGYGSIDREGKPIRDEAQRLAHFEYGLELLESVSCPLVLGDVPDMTPAIGIMLSRSQVPETSTLERMNERLREWAAPRTNVTLVSLRDLAVHMRSGEPFRIGDHAWPANSNRLMMQADRLHPTTTGLIAITQAITNAISTSRPGAPGSVFDAEQDAILQRVRAKHQRRMDVRRRERTGAPVGAGR